MAEKSDQTVVTDQDDELYTIEASVVTGFEESARGEAKEKFETEVKAARGKITWRVPLDRVKDVLKMGSVDNCKVVIHSVPHFKFTNQHDSLAGLQKMVRDVDWESGLKVWRCLNDFPHPIPSRPENIPSADDLVDVVIATRQPPPKDKPAKKNKNKKEWGKKKGKKREEDEHNKENMAGAEIPDDGYSRQDPDIMKTESLKEETLKLEHCESNKDLVNEKGDGSTHKTSDAPRLDEGIGDNADIDVVSTPSAEPDGRSQEKFEMHQSAKLDSAVASQQLAKADSDEESQQLAKLDSAVVETQQLAKVVSTDESQDSTKLDSPDKNQHSVRLALPDEKQQPGKPDSTDTEKNVPYWPEPEVVVIRRLERGTTEEPKIDIRVVMPETVFPTTVHENDQRDVEPMDFETAITDHTSPIKDLKHYEMAAKTVSKVHDKISFKAGSHYLESEQKEKADLEKTEVTQESKSVSSNNESPQKESSGGSDGSPPSRKISESEFASIVIKRLISPLQPPSKEDTSGTLSPKMSCVTPPPTPIRCLENPFANHQDKLYGELLPFLDDSVKMNEKGGSLPEVHRGDVIEDGSSVDPPLPACEDVTQANCATVSSNSLSVPSLSTLAAAANTEKDFHTNRGASNSLSASPNQHLTVEENLQREGSSIDVRSPSEKKKRDPTKPTFRVTCNRTGECHPFDSTSAAASFGSAIITYFNWQVDLKNFDIEVILNIDNEEVAVALALTKSSLHYRNLVAFGPTTLRATICYNMLRLCHIKNGDFVCDPMCGSSAISIEGALNWTNCYHFCGDSHVKALEKTAINIAAVQESLKLKNRNALKIDALRWDVQHLPLRDKCVDVFVSDLPFGHRLGSKSKNRYLYPNLLSEMARTARIGARACLLTEDKGNLIRAVQTWGKYWQRRLVLNINIGGLSAFVFILTRTTAAVTESLTDWKAGARQTAPGASPKEAISGNDDGVGSSFLQEAEPDSSHLQETKSESHVQFGNGRSEPQEPS